MRHALVRLSRFRLGLASSVLVVSLLAMAVFFSGVPASTADATTSQPALLAEASAITPLLSYQGQWLDSATGALTASGVYPFVFRIYATASGGQALWAEAKELRVSNGLFITLLGDAAPLPATIFSGQELWLGIQVGAEAEATPRQPLTPAAHAVAAGDAGPQGVEGAAVTASDSLSGTLNLTKVIFEHPEGIGAAYLEIDPTYAGASGFRLGSDDQALFNGVRDTTYQLGFNVHPVNPAAASLYLQWEEWYQFGSTLSRSEFMLIGKQPASAGGAYVRPWQVNLEHNSDEVHNFWEADSHSWLLRKSPNSFSVAPTRVTVSGMPLLIAPNDTSVQGVLAVGGTANLIKMNSADKVELGTAGYGVVVPDELTVRDHVNVRSGDLGGLNTGIVLNQGYSGTDDLAHYIKSVNTNSSAAENRVAFFISDATSTGNNEVLSVTGNKRVGINHESPAGALHVETGSDTAAVPVLYLKQADASAEFMRLVGASGTDAHSSLVDPADVPEMGALAGWIKVHIEDAAPAGGIADGTYYVPFYQGLPDARADQAITFAPLPDRTLGDPPFALSAAASSGLPVSFASSTPAVCMVSGNTVTLIAAGPCTVVASQPGDAAHHAAPDVARAFTVQAPVEGPEQVYVPLVSGD